MTDVNAAACQELGLTMSAKKTKALRMRSKPSTASNTLRFETKGQYRKLKVSYPSHSPLAQMPLHSHRSNAPPPRLNTYVVRLDVRPMRQTFPRSIYPNFYFNSVPPRPSSSISSTKRITQTDVFPRNSSKSLKVNPTTKLFILSFALYRTLPSPPPQQPLTPRTPASSFKINHYAFDEIHRHEKELHLLWRDSPP